MLGSRSPRSRPASPCRPRVALALAGALAALAAGSSAASTGGTGGGTATGGEALPASPAGVRDYWTPERMREARPPGLFVPGGGSAAKRGNARGGNLHQRVHHVERFSQRAHGKVFFSSDGLNYVCSGTAVRSPSESTVWTAGHCAYEPGPLGGPVQNFMFVPGFHHGKRPFGEWPAIRIDATDQWKNSEYVPVVGLGGDIRYDFGAARVAKKGNTTLQERIGARRIAFGRPRDQQYRAFGYPAQQPPREFNGRRLFRCDSEYLGPDNSVNDPKPMKIACDMTGGSSGGGWVAEGRVSSVVSYGYRGQDRRLYGPYQGAAARELFNDIRGG